VRAHTRISLSVDLTQTHILTRTHWNLPFQPHAHSCFGWAGGVGPRTTAHVLDCSQIRALRQPGHYILGPLVANVVAAQAGERPPTQSVTHTDTDKGKEATQGYTHTQFREARPKADTYTRTASAHVVRSHRETDICCTHTQTNTHTYIHSALGLSFSFSLPLSCIITNTGIHTSLSLSLSHTHMLAYHSYKHTLYLHIHISSPLSRTHTHTHTDRCTHRHTHAQTDPHTHYRQSNKRTHTHRLIHTSTALPLFPSHTQAHTSAQKHACLSLSLSA
jgi:hypothetical protein